MKNLIMTLKMITAKLYSKWKDKGWQYEVKELPNFRFVAVRTKDGIVEKTREFQLKLNVPIGEQVATLKFERA